MKCFHNFTPSLWEIFSGNLLLFICSVFYLVWWVVSFRTNSSGGSADLFCIMAALISGFVAIVLLAAGIHSLSHHSDSLPVRFILIGIAVLFIVLLMVTTSVFHRPPTSELMIIHIWTALELSAVIVLYGTGRWGSGRTAILTILVAITAIAGLICYMLYYHLTGMQSYWDGMIPLIMDAFVMAVFLGVLAVS